MRVLLMAFFLLTASPAMAQIDVVSDDPSSTAPAATQSAPVPGITSSSVETPEALRRRAAAQADLPTPSEIWARPGKIGGNTAVYLHLRGGAQDDTLKGVASAWAEKVELHNTETDSNGVVRMRPQSELNLPSGSHVELAPRGLHIMLMGLKRELRPGQFFPVILQFAKAGEVRVMAQVRAASGAEASAHDQHTTHDDHGAHMDHKPAAPSTSPTPPAQAHKH